MVVIQTKMKQTWIPWIWEIPENWDIVKVWTLCNIWRWRVINAQEMADNHWDYPVYSSQTSNDWIMWYLNSYEFEWEYATWTTDWANAWRVFLRNWKFNCTNVCWTLKNKNEELLEMWLLPYALNFITRFYVRYDINPKLMNNVMAKVELPLPNSKKAQINLINYLDKKTEQINTFIKNKKRLIELLEEQKISIINKAVTKWLDENVKMKDSWIPWVWNIPENWWIIKLKFLWKIVNWSTPSSWEEKFWNWDIDWITPTDLWNSEDPHLYSSARKITDLWLNSCWTTIIPKNSVIISCRAPIWSLWITTKEMCTNQWCKWFIPNSKVNYKFVYYYLLSKNEYIQSLWKGTTFYELSTTEYANSKFILPRIDEQIQIIKYIEDELDKINNTIQKIEKEISLIEEYRDSLIYHAVTWKLNMW